MVILLVPLSTVASIPLVAMSAPAEKPEARKVCKYSQQTGTRFKKRTCKTAAEWEAMAEAHRDGLRDAAGRPQIQVCDPRNGCN
jgi:hypothetical protein